MLTRPEHEALLISKTKALNHAVHVVTVSNVLPTYLSKALCIVVWSTACMGQARPCARLARCVLDLFSDQMQQFVVSERDNNCTCAHNLKMVSYSMGSSCSVVEGMLGFASVEVTKMLSVCGSAH